MKLVDGIGRLSKITHKLSLRLLTNHQYSDKRFIYDLLILVCRYYSVISNLKPVSSLPRTCSHTLSVCRLIFKVVNIMHMFILTILFSSHYRFCFSSLSSSSSVSFRVCLAHNNSTLLDYFRTAVVNNVNPLYVRPYHFVLSSYNQGRSHISELGVSILPPSLHPFFPIPPSLDPCFPALCLSSLPSS